MLRFGTITEVNASAGTARVKFEEDDIVSAPLPVVQRAVSGDKFFSLPSPGDQVACLMDENAETGAVLGSVYSSAQTPPSGATAGSMVVRFEDGTTIKYDKAGPKITVEIDGEVEVKCTVTKIDGDLEVTGSIEADGGMSAGGSGISTSGEVTARAGSAPVSLSGHIHPTPAGPSSPPTPGT